MNPVAEEIRAVIDGDENALIHYGMPRRSGRYPYGSGKNPYQHGRDFLGRIEELKKNGWTETPENIEKEFHMSTTQYRAQKSIATDDRKLYDIARAKSLSKDGLGPTEIGRMMNVNESTVRGWLNSESESRLNAARNAADFIRKQIEEKGMIDVGTGVELELNISRENLKKALTILEMEGYPVYNGRFEQATNQGQFTTQKVICPKGTPNKDIYNLEDVHSLNEYITRDGGETFEKKFHYPESMDSKRLMIRYAEDAGPDGVTGVEKDGIIELRRNVKDLSLGESRYSQVRILVDGTHYLKGMAVYSDDMPDGVDVIFNTNKKHGTDMKDVLKKIKDDPDNPFGSAIKDVTKGGQYWYEENGEKKLGLINKRADEGDWTEWKDTLPSQFLSKQSLPMAKKQLGLAEADKYDEYNDILSITNPTIKKHYLKKFADECDAAAVSLQAAALPGQKYHVIIPVNALKETEIYAPNYEDGTKLALIRYPHGGTFEIPICTVNNKNTVARKLLGTDVRDAVGINAKVAERLSGADFDGDTVMCIPTHDKGGKVKIKSTQPLKGLVGFDPKASYQYDKKEVDADGTEHYYRNGREFKIMKNTGTQMGIVSNLICDMTLQGAKPEELAAAVRHSMVVIDAAKHKLDYKQSEIDNNIAALKKSYQTGGASTLISRSKGELSVDKRQGTPYINTKGKAWYDPSKPEGSYIYKTADDLYYPQRKYDKETGTMTLTTTDGKKISYNVKDREAAAKYAPVKSVSKNGKTFYGPEITNATGEYTYKVNKRTQASTRMAEASDARDLISVFDTPMERAYAEYANKMKSLANQARKEYTNTGKVAYSSKAASIYSNEVKSLEEKLKTALLNTPKERAAQRLANAEVAAKKKEKESKGEKMSNEDLKKAKQQAITKHRTNLGSIARRDRSIFISDREWEAIQAGAISETQLIKILNNTDVDNLRQRATPRTATTLSSSKISRIKAMRSSNYTLSQIAQAVGVSESTVYDYLKGEN